MSPPTFVPRYSGRRCLLATTAALLLAVGGCSPTVPPATQPSAASPAPTASGSTKAITVVMGTDVETLDPHLTSTRNTQVVTEALYSGLFTRSEKNEIVPDLASEWKVSEDKLSWTIKLRQDAKFSDGTPVTAEAVKFSFDRIQNPETKSNVATLLAPIERTEVIDPATVRIVTRGPFAPLLANLSEPGPKILQPAAVQQWGKDYGQHPLGSGPYRLHEYVPGERTVLVRNPHYFGKAANIGTITLRGAKEGGARTATLESGQADVVTNIPPEAIGRLKANADLSVTVAPSSFLIFFVMDLAKKPFDDLRVRQAANLAVDREAVVKTVLGGLGDVATAPLGKGVLGRSEFEPWPYDPAKAKQLLADAGHPGGVEMDLWAPEGRYLKDRQVAEAVQGYLQAAGFKPRLRIMEWGAYIADVFKPQVVPNLWLIGASIPDAHRNMVNNFRKGYYPNHYSNSKVEELLDQAGRTFEDDPRQKLYTEIQQIVFRDDPPMLYLHDQRQVLGSKKSITGLNPLPFEIFYLAALDVQ
jgi:ABC-type transport system substrate-binding protein